MTSTVYFDTNSAIDVFEDRKAGLFQRLLTNVESGNVQLIASDILLVETLEGNHLPKFATGAARLFSLAPKWLYIASLTSRELLIEYDPMVMTDTVGALLDWTEILPLITEHADLSEVPDLSIPTVDALMQLYPPGTVKQDLRRRDNYLKQRQKVLAAKLASQSKADVFVWLVSANLKGQPRRVALANELLLDPDRAPAFRLNFELDCLKAPSTTKWLKNPFFDRLHVGALPYVDLFVTSDSALVKQLEWYDANVRGPAEKKPYMPKVCRDFAEFERRVLP